MTNPAPPSDSGRSAWPWVLTAVFGLLTLGLAATCVAILAVGGDDPQQSADEKPSSAADRSFEPDGPWQPFLEAEESTDDDDTEGKLTFFDQVEVGACLSDDFFNATEDLVIGLHVVDCAIPHLSEVYHIFDLPEGPYPGDEQSSLQADDGCFAQFEAWAGTSYYESEFYYLAFSPTEDNWDFNREVVCVASSPTPREGAFNTTPA